ncbi:MAG: NAD(P)-binding protein [Pseudomonadota bacterium]
MTLETGTLETETLETDYLIIGAGAAGLAFADEMLNHSDAHMTLVDKRHAPGGHWNDAYPFVTLHQPSAFYGVNSKELSDGRIDDRGVNAGYMSLASGAQVTDYFHSILRDRLLPSGRVSFLPMTQASEDGSLKSMLSGEPQKIHVRRKIVNAGYQTNSVPRTHERKFKVAPSVRCEPPNDLPRLAPDHDRYVVLGAGKTAIDSLVWMLTNGVSLDAITWVMPRDPWLWNRATTQPTLSHFEATFGGLAAEQEALAAATDAADFAHRMEQSGRWLRIDPSVEPQFFHAATVSEREVSELRKISDIIRMGRVQEITEAEIVLDGGRRPTPEGALVIDCTAQAIAKTPLKTVFDGNTITVQMIRFPQITFSAALIAFMEATIYDDAEKNKMAAPIPLPDSIEDYFSTLLPDYMNRYACGQNTEIRRWIAASRLDGFIKVAKSAPEDDAEKQACLKRLRDATMPAAAGLQRLVAQSSTDGA